jgi:hypothetical protein
MGIEMSKAQQDKCLEKVCIRVCLCVCVCCTRGCLDTAQIDKNGDGNVSIAEFMPTIRTLLVRLLKETGATVCVCVCLSVCVLVCLCHLSVVLQHKSSFAHTRQGEKQWTEMWSTAVGTYWFHLTTGDTTFVNPHEENAQ